MAVPEPTLESLGDHDYLVRFGRADDTPDPLEPVVVRVYADPTVVAQIAADEPRVVAATAECLIARHSAEDLPAQIDLDELAAAYDDYVAELHRRLSAPPRM